MQFSFDSVPFNSIPFRSVPFNSIQFNSIRFDNIQFNAIQSYLTRFHSVWFVSVQFHSTWIVMLWRNFDKFYLILFWIPLLSNLIPVNLSLEYPSMAMPKTYSSRIHPMIFISIWIISVIPSPTTQFKAIPTYWFCLIHRMRFHSIWTPIPPNEIYEIHVQAFWFHSIWFHLGLFRVFKCTLAFA